MTKTIAVVITLVSFSVFGQDKKTFDKDLLDYIRKDGNYANLKDTQQLPYRIKYCQRLIEEYLVARKENPADYFVSLDYIKQSGDTLTIHLSHIDGFRKAKRHENGERVLSAGNASGKDGTMDINTNQMKVLEFYLEQ